MNGVQYFSYTTLLNDKISLLDSQKNFVKVDAHTTSALYYHMQAYNNRKFIEAAPVYINHANDYYIWVVCDHIDLKATTKYS